MSEIQGEPETYCRDLEAYLCRKNDGHLVRIVGPAFEQVCGWAARGIPLRVAQRGIDRYFERYYAKGRRRRPVRLEFCEADILDVFDEWRRAVGVPAIAADGTGDDEEEPAEGAVRRHASLPAHLERTIARLTALRGGEDRAFDDALDGVVQELDAARVPAKALRGDARAAFLDRLRVLDRTLLDAARAHCDGATIQLLAAEADAELAPFKGRMPPDVYAQSRAAAIDRALRERLRLPVVRFE